MIFVLNPDPYLLPSYRISPFSTPDVAINYNLPYSDLIDDYFNQRFDGHKFYYTINGRSALSMALSYYSFVKEDVVTILTTSGNYYISKCVTDTISHYCSWSREIKENTRLFLVNHEFGFPYQGLRELKRLGLPIIEDCAHSFYSYDIDQNIGKVGDFVVYSFPKMFPIQIGGLLLQNIAGDADFQTILDNRLNRYIKNVMSHYVSFKKSIISKRLENYALLKDRFNELGFSERFIPEDSIVPGVFMFRTGGRNLKMDEMKRHFWAHGIQCSVFYGEDSFFIPVHHRLELSDTEYFYEVMKLFLSKNS